MYTTRSFVRGILALGLVAILSGYGLAAEQPDNETTIIIKEPSQGPMTGQESGMTVATDQAVLRRASNLMGKPLRNVQGEKIGTIYDLVLTEDFDNVSYAAIATGGFIGVGKQLHAVPWSAIQLGINDSITAPVSKSEWQQARGFSENYWPTEGYPRWAGRPGERTEEVTYGAQTAEQQRDVQNRRVSRIRGMIVRESQGRSAGVVRDLVVAMGTGRLAYGIVSYGGLAGVGQRYSAVPGDAMIFEPQQRTVRLEVSQDVLQANSFAPSQFPNLSDPVYAREIHESYGIEMEPDYTVFGYVAPEEPPTPEPAERPAPPAEPPMDETTAAPTAAELSGAFNAACMTTLEGAVTEIGKTRFAAMDRDILWLRLRTNEGQTVLVNVGPRDYISRQDFYVVEGDRITLTGSHVQAIAGTRVFLPTRIIHENHLLRLRDSSGNALWEVQRMPEETDVLGYVPGEEQAADREEPTDFARAGTQAIGAFDLTNVQTIEGTVAEIGKSEAAESAADIVWLRVITAESQPINVQVGPRDYISRQNFFVVEGDHVRMSGWEARLQMPGATPVFILTEITHDGQVLHLRNLRGEPLWGPQAGVPEQRPGITGQVPADDEAEYEAESQP